MAFPLRVGVHLQALRPGQIGGLEDYVRRLVELLPACDPALRLVLYCAEHNADTFTATSQIEIERLTADCFARLDARRLEADRIDVWFCPLLVLEPPAPGLPAVASIPDLQHETYPGFFAPDVLAWRRSAYRRSVEIAARLITFSHHSHQELVKRLGADPERTDVTYLAGALPAAAAAADPTATRRRLRLPPRFVFYPAAAWQHKNHETLFAAVAELDGQLQQPLHVVLTGARVEGGVDLQRMARRMGIADSVHLLGYLPKEDLPALYASSLAMVYPSLCEGFAMPLVEAMTAGCPVLAADAACLPEVGGSAPVYFDPQRPERLCELLRELCDVGTCGGPTRQEMIDAGRKRARDFSWQATAEATLASLRAARLATGPARLAAPPRDRVPLFTIVTPSLNQGPFIERTLDSVLGQDYPRLQHLVIDGGSTDATLAILERYRSRYPERLEFVTEPDGGQAQAVNRGLERARGDLIGWLNSDDTYEAGALLAVAAFFHRHPGCDVVHGRADFVDADDRSLGPYPTRVEFGWHDLVHECYLCQPAVFFRRRIVEAGFRLDERLQLCMDYDLWIRLLRRFEIGFVDRRLAHSRLHEGNKTLSRTPAVYEEIFRTVKKHYGYLPYSWALGKAHHVWAGVRPFTAARKPGLRARLGAFWLLARHNAARPLGWPPLIRQLGAAARAKLRSRRQLRRDA